MNLQHLYVIHHLTYKFPMTTIISQKCFLYVPWYRGPALFHLSTRSKRLEQMSSTVIMAVCSLFNRMLLSTDLIPAHLLHCGRTVITGCNHTSLEWIRAVRHIYRMIHHMQGVYMSGSTSLLSTCCSSKTKEYN